MDQILQQNQPPMGTKRGRFLMRQPRIKRESDSSQPSDTDLPTLHYLNVPHLGRVERQHSDPLPAHSPPPGNLLSVPGGLVKQHSHPLLPSQIKPVSVCFVGRWYIGEQIKRFSLCRRPCISSWCRTVGPKGPSVLRWSSVILLPVMGTPLKLLPPNLSG